MAEPNYNKSKNNKKLKPFTRLCTERSWVEGGFKVETHGDDITFEKVHEFDEPMDDVALERVTKETKNGAEFALDVHKVMVDSKPGVTFNQILEQAKENYYKNHVNNYPFGR